MKRSRLLIACLALLLCGTAEAGTRCTVPPFYDGYSATFPNPTLVSGFIYGLDEKFMWVTFTSGSVSGIPNVPQSLPQAFNYTQNPDQFYATRIKPVYKQVLQAENCLPLLAQNGNYLLAQ